MHFRVSLFEKVFCCIITRYMRVRSIIVKEKLGSCIFANANKYFTKNADEKEKKVEKSTE